MFKLTMLTAILAIFGLSQLAISEEMPQAAKRENVDYYTVVLVKYKTGMAGKAGDILRDKFQPAGKAAGVEGPWIMHMQTGQWDSAFFWNNGGSMGAYDWYRDEDGIKWYAEFIKQSGGKDKADAIRAEYDSMVARSSSQIGHHHKPKEEAK